MLEEESADSNWRRVEIRKPGTKGKERSQLALLCTDDRFLSL